MISQPGGRAGDSSTTLCRGSVIGAQELTPVEPRGTPLFVQERWSCSCIPATDLGDNHEGPSLGTRCLRRALIIRSQGRVKGVRYIQRYCHDHPGLLCLGLREVQHPPYYGPFGSYYWFLSRSGHLPLDAKQGS